VTAGDDVRLLLSAGRGPAECAWAVAHLVDRLEADAAGHGVRASRTETVDGPEPGTYRSVLLTLAGADADAFAASWSGTLCWQATSPYWPGHARRNWFVVARVLPAGPAPRRPFDPADVDLVACRTGGPGGQHRNKASTAVRATHRPTGLVVVVDVERRLSDNRRVALRLLRERLEADDAAAARDVGTDRWSTHDRLVRGRPARTERPQPRP